MGCCAAAESDHKTCACEMGSKSAVIVCEDSVIETRHLPPGFGQTVVRPAANDPDALRLGVGTTVEEAEKLLILKTLSATHNNKTRAAEILGISLKTLHNKLKEYGSSAAAEAEASKELEPGVGH